MSSFPKEQQSNPAQISDQEIAALAGTDGTPADGNRFVTESDSRITVLPVIRKVTVQMPTQRILNGAIQLLAGPGAHKFNQVILAVIRYKFGTRAFTGGGPLQIYVGNVPILDTDIPASIFTVTQAIPGQTPPPEGQVASAVGAMNKSALSSHWVGGGIYLQTTDNSTFADGDGTAVVSVLYYQHDLS
jgi:hypothetical protein